jgi:MerR family transcriptional regulator, light-induced transcriptional regulator
VPTLSDPTAMTTSTPARFRIHAVAKATGVSEHALRVWERRYGSFASSRSEGGYRLYTDEDVERIRLIKSLLDSGHAIGEVAALSPDELSSLVSPTAANGGGGRLAGVAAGTNEELQALAARVRERFLGAMAELDTDAAAGVLSAAVAAFEPFAMVNEVVGPLLREIGDRWGAGTFTVAQEHAASAIVRLVLGGLLRDARRVAGGPTVVATTPEGELHEFGALLAGTVAASAGAHVIYLGPSTPAGDLASAVVSARADAVLLSVVALPAAEARRRVVQIRKKLPPEVELYVGGDAAPRGARAVPGVVVLATLHEARDAFRSPRSRR